MQLRCTMLPLGKLHDLKSFIQAGEKIINRISLKWKRWNKIKESLLAKRACSLVDSKLLTL